MAEFEDDATSRRSVFIDDNYQAVYRRILSQVRCADGVSVGPFASYQVDDELYPDLGFGEIAFRLTNVGVNNYYMLTKVASEGSGSRVEILTGNQARSAKAADDLVAIAQGRKKAQC